MTTKLSNVITSNNRLAHYYIPEMALYRTEIHLIEAIGRQDGLNITSLAHISGVSKSSISKQVNKLAQKGLVEKYQLDGNKKEVVVKLSELGRRAYEGHRDFHERQNRPYIDVFEGLSERDRKLIIDFVELYIKTIDEIEYDIDQT